MRYLMKNHHYTKIGSLGQDFSPIFFAKTFYTPCIKTPRDRAKLCVANRSESDQLFRLKSEKHCTSFPRHKAEKIQVLFNGTDAHCSAGKVLPNFGLIFLPSYFKASRLQTDVLSQRCKSRMMMK